MSSDLFRRYLDIVTEMDKSAPQPGRDGKVSHSTYGSRDKEGSDYFKGKEAPGKPVTAKQASKDALDILKKSGVAEGYQLNEGAIEKLTSLAKKIPGFGKYYKMAQELQPNIMQILKTSQSGEEVTQLRGIGNSQGDANRIAADWLRRNGYGVSGEGYEVVPLWREA